MSVFEAKCNDQIQHICLSKYAFDIICSDSVTFLGKINISGFINRVIANTIDSPIMTGTSEAKKLNKICRNIRLNNYVFSELYPSNNSWFGYKQYKSPGAYINDQMEKYARNTFYYRERFFFKDFIEILLSQGEAPDSQQRVLKITLLSGAQFDFKFHRLSADYEGMYNYLIGQASECNLKLYKTASFRLSRIKEIRFRGTSFGSGYIKNEDRTRLESEVKIKGVEYLIGNICSYTVKLSSAGERLYNSVFHLRPIFDSSYRDAHGNLIVNISATEKQIHDYFFKFGKEAYIISPESTRKLFIDEYQEAVLLYGQENSQRL